MTDDAPAGGPAPGTPGPGGLPSPGMPARHPAGPGGPYAVGAPGGPYAAGAPHPASPYPAPGSPYAVPGSLPAPGRPPSDARQAQRRVDPLPGTPFGLVHLQVAPVLSGPAVGALVAGIASILLSVLVLCFGAVGARADWGIWAASAAAILTTLVGAGGVVVGRLAQRQIARTPPPPAVRFTGRGVALGGMICGAVGVALALAALALALLLALA